MYLQKNHFEIKKNIFFFDYICRSIINRQFYKVVRVWRIKDIINFINYFNTLTSVFLTVGIYLFYFTVFIICDMYICIIYKCKYMQQINKKKIKTLAVKINADRLLWRKNELTMIWRKTPVNLIPPSFIWIKE